MENLITLPACALRCVKTSPNPESALHSEQVCELEVVVGEDGYTEAGGGIRHIHSWAEGMHQNLSNLHFLFSFDLNFFDFWKHGFLLQALTQPPFFTSSKLVFAKVSKALAMSKHSHSSVWE